MDQREELQKLLAEQINRELKTVGYSLLKGGMRAGKTVMTGRVLDLFGATDVYIYSKSIDMAKHVVAGLPYKPPWDLHYNLPAGKINNPQVKPVWRGVAVIDEAMWLPHSYSLFMQLCDKLPVFVTSSRGPIFSDLRWQVLPGHSFASWDLNPNLSVEDFHAAYARDPNLALRDLCAY